MMKILLTGALGFVGVNLLRVLAARENVRVVAADAVLPDSAVEHFLAPVAANIDFVALDVTDRDALCRLVHDHRCTHIIHGAAVTPSPEQEVGNTAGIVDVNYGGTVNVLHAAATVDSVRRLVFLSSSGVYGLTTQVDGDPIGEDAPLVLDNLYAITKRSAELLTARYAVLHNKPMVSVRLGPIYGPMERTSSSRRRLSPPGELLAAWRAGRPVAVAGADVIRDWTYAADVGAAILALLAANVWRHPVYNLSYGKAVSLRRMVDAFAAQGLMATWREDVENADIVMRPTQIRTPMLGVRLLDDTGYCPQTAPETGVAQICAGEQNHI